MTDRTPDAHVGSVPSPWRTVTEAGLRARCGRKVIDPSVRFGLRHTSKTIGDRAVLKMRCWSHEDVRR